MNLSPPRAAAGLCAILALAAASAAAASAGAPAAVAGRASAASAAANRASAAADVRALLELARLPAGAVRLSAAPPGGAPLDSGRPSPLTPNLIDAHSWWRVPGTMDALLAYVKAHPPRGSTSGGSGSGTALVHPGASKTVTVGDVSFNFAARPGVIDSRALIVSAVSIGAGAAAVRVDAEDVWEIPRPASERIPAGVHEIDVVEAPSGGAPSVSAHVVDASKVAAIVKLLDALPIVQPGAVSCPMIPAGAPAVTLTLRSKSAGAVLARASQLALAIGAPTPCDPLTLSIGGRAQTPLMAGSGFLTAVGKLLGLRLVPAADHAGNRQR